MRILLSIFFLFNCAYCVFSAEVVKIAFLATDLRNPANAAVFNGLTDALKDMKRLYNCEFQTEYISADNSSEKQITNLEQAFLKGYNGALIMPIDSLELAKKISHLKGRDFTLVSVGKFISKSIPSVSTDKNDVVKKLKSTMKRLSKSSKYSLVCYFKSPSGKADEILKNEDELSSYFTDNFTLFDFRQISSTNKILKLASVNYYGVYAKQNAIEISRYDAFGEIFFSPWILADMSPIKRDTDRVFTICLGALPQLEMYLRAKQIDVCIYDDYYGWGYFAARDLAERICSKKSENMKHRLIPALEATPETVDSFSEDWRRWIK